MSAPLDRALLGAVLVGGRSRRYGAPKEQARVGGRSMLERSVSVLVRAGAGPVVIVGDRTSQAASSATDPAPRISDRPSGRGPAGGLRGALLEAARLGAPGVLLTGCDLPLLTPEVLRLVAEEFLRDEGRAVVPESPGPLGFEPLAAAYPVSLLPVVEAKLKGGRTPSLRSIFDGSAAAKVPLERIEEAGDPERLFLNVNRPEDRRRAEALLETSVSGFPPIVSVVGWKDSGKTTVVVALVAELVRRGRRVMTVKHGHRFELDHLGTDSWRHRHEGGAARVVLAGPDDMAVVGGWSPEGEPGLEKLVHRYLPDADLVVAEGFKGTGGPRIEVHREGGPGPLLVDPRDPAASRTLALVTDRTELSLSIPVIHPDDPTLASRLADRVEETFGADSGLTPPGVVS